jgi:polyhydroxybutyrate depolymerase
VDLFVPSNYNGQSPMPLVILLHGGGQIGADTEGYLRFLPLAEARGFLYCYPNGTPLFALAGFGWNGTDALSDPATDWGGPIVDDAGYLRDLIGEIGQRFAVDRKRVYLVGHSNGGMMAYRMACQSADLIAGIASLAGPMFFDPSRCAPSEPVSILHINGTADEAAQYWGCARPIPEGVLNTTPAPGAVRAIQTWAGYNGAHDPVTDPAPTLDLDLSVPGLDTVVTRYTQHPPGGAVELWTIEGGGHNPTLSLEFSPRVVDWLLDHRKP